MSILAFNTSSIGTVKQKLVILVSLICCLSANCQSKSDEIRIPDFMHDEMKCLDSQEKSLKDTLDGLGSIYNEERRKTEIEKIHKQQQELREKIKQYQEIEFKKIQEHRTFQNRFKKSISVLIATLKLNTVYKNVRFSQNGEVFPELTIINFDGHSRTIKVLTSSRSTEFFQSTNATLYFAK